MFWLTMVRILQPVDPVTHLWVLHPAKAAERSRILISPLLDKGRGEKDEIELPREITCFANNCCPPFGASRMRLQQEIS